MVELQKARPEFLTLFKKPKIRYSSERDRNRSGPSFPSGHVTNNITVAVILALCFFGAGAGFISSSRRRSVIRAFTLGAHWPSDVLATIFLAAGETLLLVALLEALWRWITARWAPQVFARHPQLIGN